MTKAILEYNLDDPQDREAHLRAVKSTDLALALWDMDQHLRSKTKYAPDSMPPEAYEALLEARDRLRQIMSEYSIDLEELMS